MTRLTPLSAALALAALALPLSIAASNAALALATLALLARLGSSPAPVLRAWRRSPLVWGLAAYCAAGLVATAFGVGPRASLHDNLKDSQKLWAVLVFVGGFALEAGGEAWPALGAGFAAAAAVGLVQAARLIVEHVPGAPLGRAHGFVHPVTYGEQLAFAAVGAACFLARPPAFPRPETARRAGAAVLALIAGALVFNQTRATVFAIAAGFAALSLLDARARRSAVWVAGALAATVALWEVLPTGGRTLLALPTAATPGNPQSSRYVFWSVAWRMFRDHPWTGVGPGHYKTLFSAYHPGAVEGETGWGSAHDLYLHQLAERGLIGALGLAAALGALLSAAWTAARRRADARALWAFAGLAAFLVMNVTETAFQTEQFATLVLFVAAWGTAEQV